MQLRVTNYFELIPRSVWVFCRCQFRLSRALRVASLCFSGLVLVAVAFCTKQCKKWRPTLAACWGLSAQSCSTASWAMVWRLKSSCLLCWWRYIQCGKLSMSGYGVCFPHSTDDLVKAEVRYLQCAKSSHLHSFTILFLGGVIKRPHHMMCHTVSKIVSCVSAHPNYEERQVILIGYCSRRASWISSYNQYDINIIESHWLQSHTIHGTGIKSPTFTINKNNHLCKTVTPMDGMAGTCLGHSSCDSHSLSISIELCQARRASTVVGSDFDLGELYRAKKQGSICNFGELIYGRLVGKLGDIRWHTNFWTSFLARHMIYQFFFLQRLATQEVLGHDSTTSHTHTHTSAFSYTPTMTTISAGWSWWAKAL